MRDRSSGRRCCRGAARARGCSSLIFASDGLDLLRADELALGLVRRARLERGSRGVADRRAQHRRRSPGRSLLPWLSDHFGGRRPWLIATGVVYVLGAFGFVELPGAAWLWAVCAGVASGAMFALVLTLPLDIEHDARRVGALVGMMLGLGYVIGAASPLVLGAVRDATGSFTSSLWLIVALQRRAPGGRRAGARDAGGARLRSPDDVRSVGHLLECRDEDVAVRRACARRRASTPPRGPAS